MRLELMFVVRRHAVACIAMLSAGMLACGDEAAKGTPEPPELGERLLPTAGNIEDVDAMVLTEPDAGIDDTTTDASFECCDITFALASVYDEQSVTLRGSEAPLNVEGGIALTREGDVWSTTVCVPPSYRGHYYYVAALAADDPDASAAFELVRHNENVSVSKDPILGTVNAFAGAATCEALDLSVHAQTAP